MIERDIEPRDPDVIEQAVEYAFHVAKQYRLLDIVLKGGVIVFNPFFYGRTY